MHPQAKKHSAVATTTLTSVAGLDPRAEQVFAIMSREVTTVRRDMTLDTAMEAMIDQDIGHIPVVDDERRVVGMLSKTDVVRDRFLASDTQEAANPRLPTKKGVSYAPPGFHEDAEPKTTVADVMSPKVLCVHDTATIAEASQLMVAHRIHGLPVVGADSRLVGFVSTMDLAAWVARGPSR